MKNTKKSTIKSTFTLVLVAIFSFGLTTFTAYAADHSGHYDLDPFVSMGNHLSHVEWWYSQDGDYYYGYRILLGANAWEDAGVGAGFTEVSDKDDSVIRIYSNDYGNVDWIGQHTPHIGYGTIKLNEYHHDSQGGYETYEEVFAHEMGHAFGLDHYDCDSELMKPKGYNGTPDPYIGDKAGMAAKY